MAGKQIEKWADDFMFRSESHNASEGPKVHLLNGSNDPLGQIAACAKMYMGEVVRDLADVTDEERRYYAAEMQKTKLKMPLESVSLHFMFENVTRAFTHQLVRQRTAAYAQESMRFAVVEDMTQAVALPPSLAGFNKVLEDGTVYGDRIWEAWKNHPTPSSDQSVRQYVRWRSTVESISENYNYLVNDGMPAEDARGLMPTNIITRVNYITNFRGLLDHAGNRLCTQAQFEWRLVFAQIAKALREYGAKQRYRVTEAVDRSDEGRGTYRSTFERSSAWQYDVLADLLRPVCYQTGKCQFEAGFDRKCSIRERVTENAEINRPSSEWDQEFASVRGNIGEPVFIGAIHPREWLADPAAAR